VNPPRLDDVEHHYLEGTLSASERRDFEARMRRSPELRTRIGEMTALRSLLAGWDVPDPSDGFADGVLDRIRREADAPDRVGARSVVGRGDRALPTAAAASATATATVRTWHVPRLVGLAACALLVVSLGFNALWILYRDALLSTTEGLAETRATPIRPIDIAHERPAPSAFYYYLDPREDGEPDPGDEIDIGP